MKQIVTTGIVLTRTEYGEADRILTILTPDQGKIRVIAKGVRKIKSKLAGGIELLSISSITFIPGRKEIGTLISTRLEKHFGHIVEDLDRTMLAYELLKRINQATEDEPDVGYFEQLRTALNALDTGVSLQLTEAWFDAGLLKLSGHRPNLETDAQQHKLEANQTYAFDFETMCFVAQPNAQYTSDHIKLLRLIFAVENPEKLCVVTGWERLVQQIAGLVTTTRKQHIQNQA